MYNAKMIMSYPAKIEMSYREQQDGIPMSIYFDRHTTYKSTAEPTVEEEINGEEPLSEFGRALKELGVEIIHAYSPQAKGRIEGIGLKKILCIRTGRTVRNGFTISHNGELYQIQEPVTNKKVTVEQHIDGKMIITNNGRSVKFQSILIRPEIWSKEKKCKRRRPTSHIPSEDHPYRKTYRKNDGNEK